MESLPVTSALALGFVLGLRHAVEADHLAAVSAVVSERGSVVGASLVGGLWGVGHTLSLVAAGLAVIVFGLRVGERAALALELCVGLMLVALGAGALRKLARGGRVHLHFHWHGGRVHAHPHAHDRAEARGPEARHTHHGLRLEARTLAVGMLHGLAGSAALMLVVLSTVESRPAAVLYVALFGVGSVCGMMLMGALVSLPLRLTAARFRTANLLLRGAAGLFSLSLGLLMVYEIGFAGALFR